MAELSIVHWITVLISLLLLAVILVPVSVVVRKGLQRLVVPDVVCAFPQYRHAMGLCFRQLAERAAAARLPAAMKQMCRRRGR
jgi:hypothetical protein